MIAALSGTTALLLLCVFTIVNIACLVLRRDPTPSDGFRSPTWVPIVGAACCLFLVGPVGPRPGGSSSTEIAGGLLAIGVVLWPLTWLTNRGVRAKKTGFRDIEHLED